MSHELRTPLNSLLILARLFADNSDGNLTDKQIEYARTIYSSGNDLLGLINDILDLAKIESGTMSIELESMPFTDLRSHLDRTFRQVAQDRDLDFQIQFDSQLPRSFYTDAKRLQQVLKNLLSNAFKFTEQGQVKLSVSVATEGWSFDHEALNRADRVIAFAVSDTGIGIAPDKQQVIFEAFQQADGTTSRKYGGTGLGLSISREIARLLNGEIRLQSELGRGSTFTLYLPQIDGRWGLPGIETAASSGQLTLTRSAATVTIPRRLTITNSQSEMTTIALDRGVEDDRDAIQPGDLTLLIIEDDVNFARILLDLARQQGFKGLVATRGNVGLEIAQQFKPTAIDLLPNKNA
jgi:hypothetical protein